MRELIKFFFDVIKRGDLFGDKTIAFLHCGSAISHFSDNLIKDVIVNDDCMTILVADFDDKI